MKTLPEEAKPRGQDIVSHVCDLIDALSQERAEGAGPLWYRGQADVQWPLLPSLLLPSLLRQKIALSEPSLLTRFRQNAAMLEKSKPSSSFDWLFLMQHYGIPTRLLDWTENPLVAAYFAVENVDYEEHAALWVLRPNKLNDLSNIGDKDEPTYLPGFEDKEVQTYAPEEVRLEKRSHPLPIAAIATRNNPRIQAQLGAFTIHHNRAEPIEKLGDGSHCRRLFIPAGGKARIRRELAALGVNPLTLFPELESIGKTLKDMM